MSSMCQVVWWEVDTGQVLPGLTQEANSEDAEGQPPKLSTVTGPTTVGDDGAPHVINQCNQGPYTKV